MAFIKFYTTQNVKFRDIFNTFNKDQSNAQKLIGVLKKHLDAWYFLVYLSYFVYKNNKLNR